MCMVIRRSRGTASVGMILGRDYIVQRSIMVGAMPATYHPPQDLSALTNPGDG